MENLLFCGDGMSLVDGAVKKFVELELTCNHQISLAIDIFIASQTFLTLYTK